MQDVTIWGSEQFNFPCLLNYQDVQTFSQIFQKIELNCFVVHHLSLNQRLVTLFYLFLLQYSQSATATFHFKPYLEFYIVVL